MQPEVLSDSDLVVIERELDGHETPFLHDIRLLVQEVRRYRALKLSPTEVESLEFARHAVKQRRPTFDIAGAEQPRYDYAIAVLDKLIDAATPDTAAYEPAVPEVALNAMTITDDQIRTLMATADRDTRKICEVALRSDDAKTRGAYLMKARRKGQARARLAEILNTRSTK